MDEPKRTLAALRERGWRVATAESCTGGLVAAALTECPGASDVFDRGFVTYANAAKIALLGVDPALVAGHGAVSEPVARAMALGASANVDIAISVTGIAGPDGGSADKPVGLVWFACAHGGTVVVERQVFAGNRAEIRSQAVRVALRLLREAAASPRAPPADAVAPAAPAPLP